MIHRNELENEMNELPEGLELAENLCSHAWRAGKCSTEQIELVISAIRSEHDQRLTLQHHAADLAQRVADLEAERNNTAAHVSMIAGQLGDEALQVDDIALRALALVAERDELRARLAELEAQEPVRWVANTQHSYCATKLYARPVPAIQDGWKLVPVNPTRDQWVAGGTAAREYLEETGRNSPTVIYTAMIAAAPEYKA